MIPVIIATALAVKLQRRVDPRLCVIAGFLAMALGSLCGSHFTSAWSPWSFVPVVLLQSIGQSFAFFATVLYLIANSDPKRSTAVSAYIQVIRIVGVEFAGSLMGTWLRYREQYHSNELGQSVTTSSKNFEAHLMALQGVLGEGTAARVC